MNYDDSFLGVLEKKKEKQLSILKAIIREILAVSESLSVNIIHYHQLILWPMWTIPGNSLNIFQKMSI